MTMKPRDFQGFY